MKTVKDMLDALEVDETVDFILDSLTDKMYRQELKRYKDFYKISGEVKDRKMFLKMYFFHEGKWRDIAVFDLERKTFVSHIDKRLFKVLLDKENEYIENNIHKEMQRSLNIILSILALLSGIIFALVIKYLFLS